MSRPLNPQEEQVLIEFCDKCSQEGLLSRPVGLGANVSTDGINDETALLYIPAITFHVVYRSLQNRRFLAARKFNVQQALTHFREAYHVRNSTRLCEFYERVDIDAYLKNSLLVCPLAL